MAGELATVLRLCRVCRSEVGRFEVKREWRVARKPSKRSARATPSQPLRARQAHLLGFPSLRNPVHWWDLLLPAPWVSGGGGIVQTVLRDKG